MLYIILYNVHVTHDNNVENPSKDYKTNQSVDVSRVLFYNSSNSINPQLSVFGGGS